jgi:hypothetical protein
VNTIAGSEIVDFSAEAATMDKRASSLRNSFEASVVADSSVLRHALVERVQRWDRVAAEGEREVWGTMSTTDWVQAGASVAAAGGVIFAWRAVESARSQARTARESLDGWVGNVQRERLERDLAEAHALDVYWGFDRDPAEGKMRHAVMVTNRSSASLYDFRAVVEGDRDRLSFAADVVPPGGWRARLRAREELKQFRIAHLVPAEPGRFAIDDTPGFSVREYSFADARGKRWTWTRELGFTASPGS